MSKSSGLPIWVTRSLDPNIQLRVEEQADVADKILADWDEKNHGKKKGISRYVVVEDADGNPLEYGGLTRQRFREAAIQEQQDSDLEKELDLPEGIHLGKDRPEGGFNPADYGDGLTTPA